MIGGEFEIAPELLAPRPSTLDPRSAFATGRAALHAIVRDSIDRFDTRLLLLPDYLCRSIVVAVEDADLAYAYYHVGTDLRPEMESLVGPVTAAESPTAVLLVDYFGMVDLGSEISALRELAEPPVVVLDQAQAALSFRLPEGADYSFTSYRKSLPAPDGAPVLSRHGDLLPLTDLEAPFVADKVRGNALKARAKAEVDAEYVRVTRAAEQTLDEQRFYEYRMSETSATILAHVDLAEAAGRRRANFDEVAALLAESGIHPLVRPAPETVPLFLPVLLERRDEVRRLLAAEGIFCPVHWPWPADVRLEPPGGSPLWTHELSLVIDQRYGAEDMHALASALRRAVASAPNARG